MPNLDEVKAQVGKLGWYAQFWARREIRELPNVLWSDEAVEDVVVGIYDGRKGVLVATARRLLFVGGGGLLGSGIAVEDFPLAKVTSIQHSDRLGIGAITIYASGNKAEIKSVVAAEARAFAEGARRRIAALEDGKGASVQGDDVVGRLERLAKLRADGALSDAEFEAQKAKVLGA
ncbi:hypothetical protein D3C72_1136500 [compost metagenome]